jgi:pheromone shutdown protein TraB
VVVLLVLEAEFWSVVELEVGGFTGALALSDCAPAGLLVVAAGWLAVLLEEAAFWSVVEDAVPLAGGFTGAFALSGWLGAWVVLVVACGAFALLGSVVGCCALPGATGVLLPEAAL